MGEFQLLDPHRADEIVKFSKALGISKERAAYIDSMRDHYMLWEHDYIKKSHREVQPTGTR